MQTKITYIPAHETKHDTARVAVSAYYSLWHRKGRETFPGTPEGFRRALLRGLKLEFQERHGRH